MISTAAASPRFRAIVFRGTAPTPDFTYSTRIALPGEHTPAGAWAAVHAAMRIDSSLIGGEIMPARVFAEIDAERDAETLAKR